MLCKKLISCYSRFQTCCATKRACPIGSENAFDVWEWMASDWCSTEPRLGTLHGAQTWTTHSAFPTPEDGYKRQLNVMGPRSTAHFLFSLNKSCLILLIHSTFPTPQGSLVRIIHNYQQQQHNCKYVVCNKIIN